MEKDEKKKAFDTANKSIKTKEKEKRAKELVAELRPHFETEEETAEFVKAQTERIKRNRTVRRIRLQRKIDPGEWDYFCTFTYDDKKHTEESFRRKLSDTFKKLDCAKRLFNKMSTSKVRYENVTNYQDLLNKMNALE